jgi:uncharacterized membrane protein
VTGETKTKKVCLQVLMYPEGAPNGPDRGFYVASAGGTSPMWAAHVISDGAVIEHVEVDLPVPPMKPRWRGRRSFGP